MATFHDFEMESITGEPVSFSDYEGKVCLAVNVASQCGFTDQYAGLATLHDEHADDGFAVLGFPCNQFGEQEPGPNEQILEFATSKYGVTFPMFAKIEVNGDGACDLYRWLREQQPGEGESDDITWNFEKFLVDREGNAVARFGPGVTPEQIGELLPDHL